MSFEKLSERPNYNGVQQTVRLSSIHGSESVAELVAFVDKYGMKFCRMNTNGKPKHFNLTAEEISATVEAWGAYLAQLQAIWDTEEAKVLSAMEQARTLLDEYAGSDGWTMDRYGYEDVKANVRLCYNDSQVFAGSYANLVGYVIDTLYGQRKLSKEDRAKLMEAEVQKAQTAVQDRDPFLDYPES